MENNLIMFYSQWADSTRTSLKTVEQLEQELKIQLDRKEVYNNYNNKMLLEREFRKTVTEKCPGESQYPIFINTRTGSILCGEQSLDALKTWVG